MTQSFRLSVLALFALLTVVSALQLPRLQFTFDFEQFFPKGDPDLEFFREFIAEFEADDNFQMVALHRPEGVFEQAFLEKAHALSLACRKMPHVEDVQSLTRFAYPVRTPFGITSVPAIHIDQPERYARDSARIMQDERFVHNLISQDGRTLVIFLKTIPSIQLDQAQELIAALDAEIEKLGIAEYHYLGRPYFQQELVKMQKREIIVSAVVAFVLVTIILFLIFRKPAGIAIALVSIGLGMLLFIGFLGLAGRELNAMAALYPVLMIMVGTSDVIHIMTKYVDVVSINVMGPMRVALNEMEQITEHWDGPIHCADTGAGIYKTHPQSAFMCKDYDEFEDVYSTYVRLGVEHPQVIGLGWCGYFETQSMRSGLVDSVTDEPDPGKIDAIRKWNAWLDERYPALAGR